MGLNIQKQQDFTCRLCIRKFSKENRPDTAKIITTITVVEYKCTFSKNVVKLS